MDKRRLLGIHAAATKRMIKEWMIIADTTKEDCRKLAHS